MPHVGTDLASHRSSVGPIGSHLEHDGGRPRVGCGIPSRKVHSE